MPVTTKDFINDEIYHENKGTLSYRIDVAWQVYTKAKQTEVRKKALEFLIYAFNIEDIANINNRLIALMSEKQRYNKTNSEYIPGKAPALNIDTKKPINNTDESVIRAINNQEILAVNQSSQQLDDDYGTKYLTAQQRASHRVNIHKGALTKNNHPFDTSTMISHEKPGFGAYTLNTHGELSVFNHYGMQDYIAHSSMNSGAPVLSAGEIKVEKGVLKSITTHSGHYKPSLFSVYRTLEYLKKHGVKIDECKVLTLTDPKESISSLDSKATSVYKNVYEHDMYETSATEIYKEISDILAQTVNDFNQQLAQNYKKDSFQSKFYRGVGSLLGSNLTTEREKLTVEFEKSLSAFKLTLKNLPAHMLPSKLKEFEDIIKDFENKNNVLSIANKKDAGSGRLGTVISDYKQQLKDLKESSKTSQVEDNSATMKKLY